MTRFRVIHGTPAHDTPAERVRNRTRAHVKPTAMLSCPRCAGHELIETKTGVLVKKGKRTGGTKQLVCASCLLNGERVVVG